MTEPGSDRPDWVVVLARMPSEPARHRMALWRELRRAGAVPLGQAAWGLPHVAAVQPLLTRLRALVTAADGTVLILAARGLTGVDAARLEELYAQTAPPRAMQPST